MHLKRLELNGFKSFAKKSEFLFDVPIIAIVGPNGSGKSNVVEAIRFVLGEQSVKSMRGKTGADLIFKGSRSIPKMSRASVQIVFDNRDRVFHLHHHNNAQLSVDFDEVVIGREVFSDGGNKYTINGHEVRMKDVHELIASINIGASGHHIISQGEADRYLNANLRERRELIEEALGLKVYQYRIKESLRKLHKSEENMRESELLRRELAPHLRFLKRQVDKIEKAKHLREELFQKYQEYFAREDFLIRKLSEEIEEEKKTLNTQFEEITSLLSQHKNPEEGIHYQEEDEVKEKQEVIRNLQEKISSYLREQGKIEGMITLLHSQSEQAEKKEKHPGFSYEQVKTFLQKILNSLDTLSIQNMKTALLEIKSDIDSFLRLSPKAPQQENHREEITKLEREKEIFLHKTEEAKKQVETLEREIGELRKRIQEKQAQEHEQQKQYYTYLARQKEIQGKRELMQTKIASLERRTQQREEEIQEARALLGEVPPYQEILIEEDSVTEISQESLHRELERLKIRLEDMGGGSGSDVIQEYEETRERDAFLAREIDDIQQSIESLQEVIADLKKTLSHQFDKGIQKINVQFDTFFKLMFGGGSAELEIVPIMKRRKKQEGEQMQLLEDEESVEKEYGLDIKVKLPRKKVSDLDMLSGGERSLTSIALLFALSQVNPPPFLILDETDAALDEANSQRYGDMVEQLSKYSQLIVVTHNRETMSRAQTLFGVTLGRDDASTMLSLRLEDAEKYAK